MNIAQIKQDLDNGVIVSAATWRELVEWAVKVEWDAKQHAQAALINDQIRIDLMRAATNCGHSIDSEQVVLYREDRQQGNALAQLADRLIEAYKVSAVKQSPDERLVHHLVAVMNKIRNASDDLSAYYGGVHGRTELDKAIAEAEAVLAAVGVKEA